MNVHYLGIPGPSDALGTSFEDQSRVAICHDDRQLELNLDDKKWRVLKIAITESIHGQTLKTIIDEVVPEFVLDLREVLRFDLPGLSRDMFFQILSARGVHYARVPMGWHNISPRAVTTGGTLPVRLHHEAIERRGGNLLLLVSRAEHALHTQALLNMALSTERRHDWLIERIA